jgi:recombination protein RecT
MTATDKLKEKAGLVRKDAKPTIRELLESLKPQLARALPKHLQAERMIRIALTSLKMNPALSECTPQSLLASVMIAAQLGLEPGVLGQCYLIPYKDKASRTTICTLVPGWLGLVDLVNRSGKAAVWSGAVYQGDEFDYELGSSPYLRHRPQGEDDPALITDVYAVGRTKSSDWPLIEVWKAEKVWKHRDHYNKVGAAHYSYKYPEQYARKVPLMQLLKYIPRSIELTVAQSFETGVESGRVQNYEIKDVGNVIAGIVDQGQLEEKNETPEAKADAEQKLE